MYGGCMQGIYSSFYEKAQISQYNFGLISEGNNLRNESQFLNSRPEAGPLIGIIPMTGEGIDAEVDDLAFVNE